MAKFQIIESAVFPDFSSKILFGFIYPLATSLLFIFAYPYPAKYVYQFWRNRQKELKEIKQKIENETLLTKEDSRIIRKEALALEVKYEEEIEKRDEEIKRLKEIIKDALNNKEQPTTLTREAVLKNQNEIKSKNTEKYQLTLLKKVGEMEKDIYVSEVKEILGVEKFLSDYIIGELNEKGFIRLNRDPGMNDQLIELTHNGRKYVIDNNKN